MDSIQEFIAEVNDALGTRRAKKMHLTRKRSVAAEDGE